MQLGLAAKLMKPELLFLAALLCSESSLAQSWYQVELLFFRQDFPELIAQGTTEEAWPDEVQLSLQEPLLAMFESESLVTPALRKLAINDRNMNTDAYAFRVTDGYQLLWHQAWQQPLVDEPDAPWIHITGGEEVDGHFELEGSLKLHLSRFLHVTADLWLTDFYQPAEVELGEAGEEDVFFLSQLPEMPNLYSACEHFRYRQPAPPEALDENEDILAIPPEFEPWWQPPFGCEPARSDMIEGKPLYAPMSPIAPPEIQQTSYMTEFEEEPFIIEVSMPRVSVAQMEELYLPIPEITVITENRAVRQITKINMNRRMRSQEFHFVDHPKLGMLVRILKVEEPIVEVEVEPEP
jgi:hypothetical protein